MWAPKTGKTVPVEAREKERGAWIERSIKTPLPPTPIHSSLPNPVGRTPTPPPIHQTGGNRPLPPRPTNDNGGERGGVNQGGVNRGGAETRGNRGETGGSGEGGRENFFAADNWLLNLFPGGDGWGDEPEWDPSKQKGSEDGGGTVQKQRKKVNRKKTERFFIQILFSQPTTPARTTTATRDHQSWSERKGRIF